GRTDPGFNPGEAVDRAIGHVVELQRSDGSFGVWSATEETVPWLDAYATDFLLRAKEHGKNVPDYALKGALAWLRDYVRQEHREKKDLPALAYAHYVLAHAGAGDLATLRYFNDTQMAELPTQLAKAQLAAALAQYGDAARAAAAYDAAFGPPPKRPIGLRTIDYGSDLRDSGAPPTTIANRGAGPAWRTVSITGVPKSDLPAESKGYTVSRAIYRQDGSPADLKKARQTDLYVVVIKAKRTDAARAARTLVVDLLPAGFEIQNANAGGPNSWNYDWLKGLTETAYVEQRDDRYIAALDLGDNASEFTLAYVVRAVT